MKMEEKLEIQRKAILELHTRCQTLERQVKGLFARVGKLNKDEVATLFDKDLLEVVKTRG